MKQFKTLLLASTLALGALLLTACENTHVSGSMSYGVGYGAGYPMYYGNGYHRHTNVVVVKPARNNRSRPVRTQRR
jgi:ABC-type oligopeptide transport system substrate-binding subunit